MAPKSFLSALVAAVLCAACEATCDCDLGYDTSPVTYRNGCEEAILLTWTHRNREHFSRLDPGDVVSVSIFDGSGCEKHWDQGLPRTSLTVELCDSTIVLMGWTAQGGYYQAERLHFEVSNLAGPRQTHLIDLDPTSLAELAAEARRAGAMP